MNDVCRAMPGVVGVGHTHSTYATAWAARGEAIPCHRTARADIDALHARLPTAYGQVGGVPAGDLGDVR